MKSYGSIAEQVAGVLVGFVVVVGTAAAFGPWVGVLVGSLLLLALVVL